MDLGLVLLVSGPPSLSLHVGEANGFRQLLCGSDDLCFSSAHNSGSAAKDIHHGSVKQADICAMCLLPESYYF